MYAGTPARRRKVKTFKRAALTVALGLVVGLVVTACNGSSGSASSGVTLAQFQALQAKVSALETTVSNLQTQLTSVQGVAKLKLVVSHANTSSLASGITMAPNAATTTTCNWTLSSVNLSTGLLHVITCDGYYMAVTEAGSGDYSYEQPITTGQIAFDGQNCTGNMYITGNSGVSVGLVQSGLLFTLDPQQAQGMSNTDYSNPAYYWKLPAAESISTFTQASFWQYGAGCETSVATLQGYLVQQDNGLGPDAPVPGPVLPSSLP